ncbi:putative signal recognition particle, SRP14 subunit, signal recognition particle, SRP9/SRP14 subunit [Rosa chinensis]|uniref:Putative signal recognition particle, SRP14 subunit, signal recognition particle, SRP9/SRP14 subunit n=1 Tax=Rosa chinensis TaxID=74649 RepID=A0A2P6SAH2_ROSCH|nr:putative signal recognition particle, SRP14 subunit, signal recognition particle, SRP9/SRP14 subunit [Rosa chinensis]
MDEITFLSLVSESLKFKVQRNKMKIVGQAIDYRCLIRATYGNMTISTSLLMLGKTLSLIDALVLLSY